MRLHPRLHPGLHPTPRRLLALVETGDDPAAAAHLPSCPRCARRVEELSAGHAAMDSLRAASSLSEIEGRALRDGILRVLDADPAADRAPRWRWAVGAAAGVVVSALLIGWWLGVGRAGLELEWEGHEWSGFERLAAATWVRGERRIELASSDAAAVRSWVAARVGVEPSLPSFRPPEDGAAFELLGASTVEKDGRAIGVVSYRVDGRPLTVFVARSRDEPDAAPPWRPWRKALRGRVLDDKTHLLTWNSAGTVYSLAVDGELPLARACLVCHTTPGRRRLIEAADLR